MYEISMIICDARARVNIRMTRYRAPVNIRIRRMLDAGRIIAARADIL